MRALREKVVGLALQIAKGSTHGAALLGMGTCAGAPTRLAEMLPPTLGQAGLRGATDPTVRGARLFPEHLDDTHGWGTDAGGGLRSIVGGVRLVSMPDGAIAVARDRLPATPSCVAVLPIRLGGGFLFGIGPRLWRATTWLGRADGLFTSSAPVAEILIGLDRVYLRGARGSLLGLDPLTGTPLGLGPLPQSPAIGRLAAIDAWRAVAIADLRGAMITLDAGSTWRPLPLPIEPTHVVALRDSIAIGGFDRNHQVEWWDVTTDGVLGRFSSAEPRSGEPAQPVANPGPSALAGPPTRRTLNSATRSFGLLPLKSAIEDGWPLSDGTALVARDGTLARVQLTDGALVEAVADAFPLKPARCHGISLASAREPGDFGFVCGEPLGATIVYRWDAASARLAELHRFGTPREVLAFGNGALGVRGPCASSTPGDGAGDTGATGSEQAWCLMAPGAAWQERRFPVDARLVVLSDGRVVLVQPPRGGDLASARLTIIDGPRVSEVPIVPSPLRSEVAPALRTGIWMDGFEERRPGVVGGWIDAAGSIVGIEIAASG